MFCACPVWPSSDTPRPLPLAYSYYVDDPSCTAHEGEETRAVAWNGQIWTITTLVSLTSPRSETRRLGTLLDVRPLEVFLKQAQTLGADVVVSDETLPRKEPHHLRLVLVVHDLLAAPSGAATYSLQSIIAVRLCTSKDNHLTSALYVSPRKGVTIKDWWKRRSSPRWVDTYREAFSLAVADSINWAKTESAKADR